jgi:hypothetical protein
VVEFDIARSAIRPRYDSGSRSGNDFIAMGPDEWVEHAASVRLGWTVSRLESPDASRDGCLDDPARGQARALEDPEVNLASLLVATPALE